MSCSIPSPPLNGEYTPASGSISFGDTLALNCTLRANEFVERKAKCIIDPGNTAVQAELGGDNINACPGKHCNISFLAHLAQSAKVSFCDTGLSVVRRPSVRASVCASVRPSTICLNIFFSET